MIDLVTGSFLISFPNFPNFCIKYFRYDSMNGEAFAEKKSGIGLCYCLCMDINLRGGDLAEPIVEAFFCSRKLIVCTLFSLCWLAEKAITYHLNHFKIRVLRVHHK